VDEVLEFCRRALLSEELALQASQAARQGQGRLERLGAACAAGRELLAAHHAAAASNGTPPGSGPPAPAVSLGTPPGAGAPPPPASLREAVTRELQDASAQLAERHREALALRERLGLAHAEIAAVMGIEPNAVAAVLARARLALRAARRGPLPPRPACPEGERALSLLARQQDHEALSDEDGQWLLDHLFGCETCEHAHAAMIEASACYRAWGEPET
jgi:DNA-directed RNA polymerase specialized sigma24 family protein